MVFGVKGTSRLYIILAATIFYMFALHTTRPSISLYAVHMGASPFLLGLLVSAFAVFPVIFSVQTGKWTDHIGTKRMIFAGGTGVFIALIIPVISPTLVGLFFSQALIGIAHNCMIISLQRGAGSSGVDRDKAIASLTFAFAIGEFIGPLFAGFSFEHLGFRFTFLIASISILIMFLVNALHPSKTMQSSSNGRKKEKKNSFVLLKSVNVRKALVASGLVVYSKDLFVAYFPMYGSKVGLSPSQIGVILALTAVASMIVRAIQYHLVEKFTRGVVLMYSLFLGGAAFVSVPFLQDYYIFCVMALVLGAGLGLGQPLSLVYILNASPPGREGELLGMRITFNRLCQLTAPALFGIVGGSMGLSPIFWTCGAFLFSGSWYSRANREMPLLDTE